MGIHIVDSKEKWQVSRVIKRIHSGDFCEDDVFLLLVILRRFARFGSALREFGDFLAHRAKDRGLLVEYVKEIKAVLDRPLPFSGTIIIRPVFSATELASQVNEVLGRYGIGQFSSTQINHIIVCVISLLQCVELHDRNAKKIGEFHVAASPTEILLIAKITLPHFGNVELCFVALAATNDLLDISVQKDVDWIHFDGVSWARAQCGVFTLNQYETTFLG